MTFGRARGVYIISVVAADMGVHPRTLRIWEEAGLLRPARQNNQRRYSEADVERMRLISFLTARQGVNLAGVRLLLSLYDAGRFRLDELFPHYHQPADGGGPSPASTAPLPGVDPRAPAAGAQGDPHGQDHRD